MGCGGECSDLVYHKKKVIYEVYVHPSVDLWLNLLIQAVSLFHYSGPPSSPTMLTTSPQSTSITLTWSQSLGDVVDSYQISYSFIIGGCGVGGGHVSTVNGSSREYTFTGLEENSNYTINVTAMNGTGSSPPATTTARTAIAGGIHPS